MGAASSVNTTPDVPEDGLDIDVPTFKKLRKLYEAKKNDMDDAALLDCLKSQYTKLYQVMGASGGAIEFPEGMGGKRTSQRQSTFLQEHGGSFARLSKLSIIQGELKGTDTRPSFNQTSLIVLPENQISRPRKASLNTSDEQYLTPDNLDPSKAERNRVSFGEDTDFDENKEGEETEQDREERKKKLRSRQQTGFVAPKEQDKVTFDEDGKEGEETDSDAAERQRKVRARQATGFVKPAAGVSFGDDDEEEGKESEADKEERQRKVRARQATGFVKGAPVAADEDDVHVSFGGEVEGTETEADKEERQRKVRARQPTGFVKKSAGVSFGDDDEEEGEESEADKEERQRKVRARQPTGFVKKADVTPGEEA